MAYKPAIARAMAAIESAVARAKSDPARPSYHLVSPAQWFSDINGPIYHNGYYHIFYQHNPYGDSCSYMHWGHARSKDLVYWEHLPVALWPSNEKGESQCYSGGSVINAAGEPMIFYTSIGPEKHSFHSADQWAVIGDKDLITWKKHSKNPILTEKLHEPLKIYDWRDPFVFEHQDITYMVIGGNINRRKGGGGVIAIYRAENKRLTEWKYMGILFRYMSPKVSNLEVPLFFPLADKWVLMLSPYDQEEYFVGSFDSKNFKFTPEQCGIVDYSENNYAMNGCLQGPNGRHIIWGWIRGFKEGMGWNGCATLPRVIGLRPDGSLSQQPAVELQKLRGEHYSERDIKLSESSHIIEKMKGDALEIIAEFEFCETSSFGLKLRRSDDGSRAVTIVCNAQVHCDNGTALRALRELDVNGTKLPFELLDDEDVLRLHMFLDKSVMEVFVNNRVCCTKVIYPDEKDLGIELFAKGGSVKVRSLDVWRVKPIW